MGAVLCWVMVMKQPCARDCPDRVAGCATTCEKWKAYVEERNAGYEERRKSREFDEVCYEGKTKSIKWGFMHRRK